jgi:flagellar assembly protein FliH
MSSPAPKFTFDTEFRNEGDLVSNAARARQKKAYSHEEIDAMCSRARGEGVKAGQVRAQEAIAAATRELTVALTGMLEQAHKDIETVRADAADIALAAARKLSRAAIAAAPQAEIEAALREAIHQAIGEPRIVLRAPPAIAASLEIAVAEIAMQEGYDGRVIVAADPHLQGADCRIEWRGAGAEHTQTVIEAALESVIARRFSNNFSEG